MDGAVMEDGAVLRSIEKADGCPMAYPSIEGAECPYPFYDWARATSPVYQLPGTSFYFLSGHKEISFVAENPALFSSVGRTLGTKPEPKPRTASGLEIRALMESDAPDHKQHRKFTFQLFEPRAMRRHKPMIEQVCADLIDSFIERGECDFVAAFANRFPALITARIAGFPDSVLDDLRAWGQIEASGAPFLPPERFAEHVERRAAMADYVQRAIEQRLETPGDDGLSQLIRTQIERDGAFSLPYVTLQAAVILAGGVSTTAHMLSMAMHLLLTNPDEMARVIADPKLIGPFIEEAMRLEAPVQWLPRRVVEDVELCGVTIPAGAHVIMGLAAGNRDETVFPDAEKFEVGRREAARHLSFGRGPHVCVGQSLARMELLIAFEQLLSRLKNIRLAPENDFTHIESASFRGLNHLNIRFDAGAKTGG